MEWISKILNKIQEKKLTEMKAYQYRYGVNTAEIRSTTLKQASEMVSQCLAPQPVILLK